MARYAANVRSASGGSGGGTIPTSGVVPYADYAKTVNDLMTQQAQKPYEANLPGYLANVTQRSQNIGSQLRGELPQDVINLIGRQAAERGIATGAPGSPNANTAYLAALGLTSVGQQQQGAAGLSQAIADTPVPQLFNPASIAVPEHMANLELNAALLGGGGGYKQPGGVTITGGAPGRAPGMDPWGSQPQGFGGTHSLGVVSGNQFGPSPGQQMGSMYVNGQLTYPNSNAQISQIAQGDVGQFGRAPGWNAQPAGMINQAPPGYSDYGLPPEGTWYDPYSDTSNAPWDDIDYTDYFD